MIYVIGGNGFVGSAIVHVCNSLGKDAVAISRENYNDYIGKSCDVLINANGNSKKFLAKTDPIWEFDASVKSVRSSLEDFKYDLYVYISSCDVYTDCSSPASSSEDTCVDVEKQSTYGFHKYLAEQCVRHAAQKWIIFRMGGFVGPGMKKNPVYDILNGGPLWLDPQSELQFINTHCAADLILKTIDMNKTNEIINLCGSGVIKLQDIMDFLNKRVEVKPDSPLVRYEVNIEKLHSLFEVPETMKAVLEFLSQYREE